MCGIIGYTGSYDAVPRLISGLKALEYRGYDSAGVAVCVPEGVRIVKTEGKIVALENKIHSEGNLNGFCGVGHTRWATHGAPTATNAHPHCAPGVTLVHNGIIENEDEWRKKQMSTGYRFTSETDTEVAASVISLCLEKEKDPVKAMFAAQKQLTGSYAFGVMFDMAPGVIYAMRKQSPLLVAVSDEGNYLASDLTAVLQYTRSWFSLEEGQVAKLRPDGVTVYNDPETTVEPTVRLAEWDRSLIEKGGYPHFMLKEIHEQPEALRKTLLPRIRGGLPYLEGDGLTDGRLKALRTIRIVACGTAMHAGLMGKQMIESLARVPVTVDIASEFRYANPILSPDDLVIGVSQSGETADTLAALRLAKQQNCFTLGIVNVKGATAAREADAVLYTHAGPEIAVASTKAYTVQMAAFALIALRLALVRGEKSEAEIADLTGELLGLTKQIEAVFDLKDQCRAAAEILAKNEDVFFLGRGADYVSVTEGSLKLKEISYIHSEAYAAGELKHGTISLITPGTPVVVLSTQEHLNEKTVSNLREAKARGARILFLHTEGMKSDPAAEAEILLPKTVPMFACFPAAVCLQQIAYETAILRDCDVDQPRNLAKSVTVE